MVSGGGACWGFARPAGGAGAAASAAAVTFVCDSRVASGRCLIPAAGIAMGIQIVVAMGRRTPRRPLPSLPIFDGAMFCSAFRDVAPALTARRERGINSAQHLFWGINSTAGSFNTVPAAAGMLPAWEQG